MSQPACATCRHSGADRVTLGTREHVPCKYGPGIIVTAFNGYPVGGFPLMPADECCSRYEDKRPEPAPAIESKVLESAPRGLMEQAGASPANIETGDMHRPSAPLRPKLSRK